MVDGEVYRQICALEYRYARLLDEDQLEAWPGLFEPAGVYRVVPRENFGRAPELAIMSCDGQGMMRDRVRSLREANVYNIHQPRHVVTNVELLGAEARVHEVACCYTVYQTDQEGTTRLYSVGQYLDLVAFGPDGPRFRRKLVVVDSFAIPNLLAIPL